MKILAISDRPPKESIKATLDQHQIELICTLGDLDQFSLSELKDVADIPKLGVYGNHDSGMYFEPLGIKNMHLATFEYGGLIFGGFEGCVRYKNDPYAKMYTQEEAEDLLKDFPRVDVMLAHCPPYGVNDEPDEIAHQGYKALRAYVERTSPKYLLHGHTYPTAETLVTRLGDTRIVYVYEDKIVDLS
jgi:uncharacterized protein